MYTINEVVKITGVPASTLRYYEQEGILPKVNRNTSGRREFDDNLLEWIEFVKALKDTGMTIEDIKAYTNLVLQGDDTVDARRVFLSEHKHKVEKSLALTQHHLEKVIRKIAIYDVLMHKKKSSANTFI
ncbi:MerR family transcriptional regulator [Peribacillus sp. SI8-4]|uniref:MerR family transcriptional regulator n=1 Tax=Peribacillus sp. SI8-4 TaxID=3048009 RepID=UPI0025535B21|nr:MerR family transcriptional regulator [Peribacillus sp. SI8-4]